MSKNIDDVFKEITKINKEIHSMQNTVSQDITDIKKNCKSIDKKLALILAKIQEFEIIMDAAELIEEQMEEEEEKYNTEWNPYDEDNYDSEDYDSYDSEEDD